MYSLKVYIVRHITLSCIHVPFAVDALVRYFSDARRTGRGFTCRP